MEAQNNGAGALVITANGDVTGAAASGINARNSANGAALTITTGAASEVTGRDNGIFGRNYGSGDLTVTADYKVTATNGTAISARAFGAGDLTIITGAASVITGMNGGIDGQNFGAGILPSPPMARSRRYPTSAPALAHSTPASAAIWSSRQGRKAA